MGYSQCFLKSTCLQYTIFTSFVWSCYMFVTHLHFCLIPFPHPSVSFHLLILFCLRKVYLLTSCEPILCFSFEFLIWGIMRCLCFWFIYYTWHYGLKVHNVKDCSVCPVLMNFSPIHILGCLSNGLSHPALNLRLTIQLENL